MATISAYTTAAGQRLYRVRYRTPDRRQTDKRGFTTKRDAQLFLASVEVSKARGEYIEPAAARVTLATLGPAWLGRQTHLKPSARRPVESAWRVHVEPRWAGVPVTEVRKSDVQQWVSDLSARRGATTVIRAYGVLAAILDEAVDDRRILNNPARGVNLPRKVSREHVYLTHEQVHRLADESKGHATLVLVLAYCGLRWGEAVGLRVRDLDMLRRRVHVTVNAVEVGSRIEVGTPKNHKQRAVPFPAFLLEHLARECEGKGRDELVFSNPDGGHLRRTRTDAGSGGWFRGAVKRAGVPTLTPHDLRHTAASLAVSAGANVKAVQRMLGHSSAAMTLDVYADLFDDDLDAVAVALDQAASAAGVGKMWARG
jgi:integrase